MKPNLTQIIVSILATGLMSSTPVRADDTAQLKQQVAQLQQQVSQLQGKLANQQQGSIAPVNPYFQMGDPDPFTQMMLEQQQMEQNMRQAFAGAGAFNPRMDMQQKDNEYIVTLDLPGMDKNKINIETKDGMLTISGERHSEQENKGGPNNNQYYRQERSFGSFMQAIPLPDDAKKDQIDAHYNNGVLTVTIPREKRATSQNNSKITVK